MIGMVWSGKFADLMAMLKDSIASYRKIDPNSNITIKEILDFNPSDAPTSEDYVRWEKERRISMHESYLACEAGSYDPY